MQSNIKYCMQLVHNDALLDSSIYGLARPIKHYIMDLLHILVHVRTLFVQFRTISTKTIQKKKFKSKFSDMSTKRRRQRAHEHKSH
jgi:hypothetical protein